MGPVQASTDGHLTELLLCICEEMKADRKHKGVDPSARSVLTALSCAISTDVSAMVMLGVR